MEVLSMGLLHKKEDGRRNNKPPILSRCLKVTASRLRRKGSELSYFDSTEGIDDTASCLLLSNTFA